MSFMKKLVSIGRPRKFGRSDDGAVAVEFALVIVPFLMMVFGVFETGQILWASSQIDFHVDRVVRIATVDASMSASAIQAQILSALDDLDASQLAVAVSRTNGTPDILRISVTYTHNPVTPFLFEEGITLNHNSAYPMIDS